MNWIRRFRQRAHIYLLNTLNLLVYLLTGGQVTLHEGRYSRWLRTWHNWNWTVRSKPEAFALPETEREICALVRQASNVRAVGGGHAFNDSAVSQGVQISLDRYNKVLRVHERGVVRVQAGIRLRDLNQQLKRYGLALPVLGSTDAQSLGGLLATDLHGTGRDHGFLSEQVRALRIINAAGQAEDFPIESETCQAAIGALGLCGLIIEVELQCVPAFNLKKVSWQKSRAEVERDIASLLRQHDHVSLYLIGGIRSDTVIMNEWMRTELAVTRMLGLRKMASEIFDMVFSGYVLGFSRRLRDNRFTTWLGFHLFRRLKHGKVTVHPSATGFGRKLFYLHDEIEYGIPEEHFRECLEKLDEMLHQQRLVAIIEVRFTPHSSRALVGPGSGRRTCFIELAPSLHSGPQKIKRVFKRAEEIFRRYGGQPHLGKRVPSLTPMDLQASHGPRFSRFQRVCQAQDPQGKFMNAFTRRVFGELKAPIALPTVPRRAHMALLPALHAAGANTAHEPPLSP